MDSAACILTEHLLTVCLGFNSARCVGLIACVCKAFRHLLQQNMDAVWRPLVLRICGHPIVDQWTHLTPLERIQHTLSPFFAKPQWNTSGALHQGEIARLRCDASTIVAEYVDHSSTVYCFSSSGPVFAESSPPPPVVPADAMPDDAAVAKAEADRFKAMLPLLEAAGLDLSYYRPTTRHHFSLLRVHAGLYALVYRHRQMLWVYGFAPHDGRFLRRYLFPVTAGADLYRPDTEYEIRTVFTREGESVAEPVVFAASPGVVCLCLHRNEVVSFAPFQGVRSETAQPILSDCGVADLHWRMWADPYAYRDEAVPPPCNHDNIRRSASVCFVRANNLSMLNAHPIDWNPDVNGIDPINMAVLEDRYDAMLLLLERLKERGALDGSSWFLDNRQALFRCRSVRMARTLIEVRRHLPHSRRQPRAPRPVRLHQVEQPSAQRARPAQVLLHLGQVLLQPRDLNQISVVGGGVRTLLHMLRGGRDSYVRVCVPGFTFFFPPTSRQLGGASPRIKNYFGAPVISSPIMPAQVIRYFITQHGLSPNEADETGQSPLHCVINGNISLHWFDGGSLMSASPRNAARIQPAVAALIRLKADVNALDNHFRSPLIYAVKEGAVGVVRLLMRHGADLTHRDANGFTAYDHIRLGFRRDSSHSRMLDALGISSLSMRLRPSVPCKEQGACGVRARAAKTHPR